MNTETTTSQQKEPLEKLAQSLEGNLQYDPLSKMIYATDASVYRSLPLGVVFPKSVADIQKIVAFANENEVGIIPRTAGTSLAGQCVGKGLVVDVSKHFTKILHVNKENKTVTVQPGVIRDNLNRFLKPYGLFFGPNTSTSNRCMIGGMVGNNSSGTTSIQYGVTRDKVLSLKAVLFDGSVVEFTDTSAKAIQKWKLDTSAEAKIYTTIDTILSDVENRNEIVTNYPKAEIHRRNTGYALDVLLKNSFYSNQENKTINLCNLLSGSEGTLAFTTEITLQLDHLPPPKTAMVCPHFETISQCMESVSMVMQHTLFTCEMMDKTILDCTKNNLAQSKNRFFIEGDPKAMLMLELKAETDEALEQQITALKNDLENSGLCYATPVLYAEDTLKALELRKAGLGLLGNIVGDKKAVACIEDTAVALEDLAPFIEEFSKLMAQFGQQAVYYAHAGAGEIHLRPILNLKKSTDVVLFKQITDAVATLVKKYKGSMSGEHGDGIVRSGYINQMLGAHNYKLLREIKSAFDPIGIFNPGKILDPYPMDQQLRYEVDREEPVIETKLNFTDSLGILRVAEKCNGSGDCRKSVEAGGGMCPSYRATKNEKDTTRARANALREVLTNNKKPNKFNSQELKKVFDLCVSCKACASECPSNVDVAALKTEFLYQYQKENGASLQSKAFGYNHVLNKWASKMPKLSNAFFTNKFTSPLIKNSLGIAKARSLPKVSKSLESWIVPFLQKNEVKNPIKEVYFFIDEFTNYIDVKLGKVAVKLLTKLNYKVNYTPHAPSGRALLSKGFLDEAERFANKNIAIFSSIINKETALIGVEPSAILSFKDEYVRLAKDKTSAEALAKNTFIIDEFLAKEIGLGNITSQSFSAEAKTIKLHVHCHQKVLSDMSAPLKLLNLPENYLATIINSGCCGMAGSFGYEKEHYEVSMQMGELSLFPKIRKKETDTLIAATGTSCRHQIYDGTQVKAQHPVEILFEALL